MILAKTINKLTTWIVLIGAAFCLVYASVLLYWGLDRTVPFYMTSYASTPAKAGEISFIKAEVKRDISRNCNLLFSKSIVDSAGIRYELSEGAQIMNSSAIREMHLISPDKLAFAVPIPKAAVPGVARMFISLDYACNPIHQFYPISLTLIYNILILPP